MQKESAKKIKSALRTNKLVVFAIALLIGILIFSIWGVYEVFYAGNSSRSDSQKSTQPLNTTCFKIDPAAKECDATLEIADNDATRIKGLSGRESMAVDQGMLFVSDQVEVQCFWMRGMLIPLDMIWLDEQKKVTKIESNISPDTYPTQFCSPAPDKYVIELAAGAAELLGIKNGQTLSF